MSGQAPSLIPHRRGEGGTGWRKIRLRYTVGRPVAGDWGDEPRGDDTDTPCVRVADFDYSRGGLKTAIPTVRSLDPVRRQARELRRGDLLLEKSGGGDQQPVGRVVMVDREPERPTVCSNFIARLRPRPGFDSRFLCYLHRTIYSSGGVRLAVRQTTGIQNLDLEHYLSTAASIPGLDEQRRIANFLENARREADTVLNHAARLRSLATERLSASREQAVVRSARWARLKWYTTSIAQGESPQAEDRPAGPEEWAVLKLNAVHRGSFRPQEHKALPSAPASVGLLPERGDLLVTRANTPALVGDCCVVDQSEGRLILPDLIYRIRLDSTRLLPRYAMHFLLSPTGRSRLEAAARGTSQSMVKLRGPDILNVELPVASSAEQTEIVHRLDTKQHATDALVSKVAALEERVRERLNALITAAVTGQLDPSSYRASALTT